MIDSEQLNEQLGLMMEQLEIQGMSVATIQDGEVATTTSLGLSNAETGSPITTRSLFEAYSLSKPPTALAALQLARDGLIDIDKPMIEYADLPAFRTDARWLNITTRMALCHTSGLPDDEGPLAFDPGEGWGYSTQAYCYLSTLIEEVTGLTFDELMNRDVLLPMQMHDSVFVWNDSLAQKMVQGHDSEGLPQSDRRLTDPDADTLLTTAADYGRFVAACLRGFSGSGDDSDLFRAMIEPCVKIGDELSWGLGWGLEQSEDDRFLWHIGGGAGSPFQNFALASVFQGWGIVVLTNSLNGGTLFAPLCKEILGRRHRLFDFVRVHFY